MFAPKTLGNELMALQGKENNGRGVSCVREVALHLNKEDIGRARQVAVTDWDKIRNYPDIAHLLKTHFRITSYNPASRYPVPGSPDYELQTRAITLRQALEPHFSAETAYHKSEWKDSTPGMGHCAIASLLLKLNLEDNTFDSKVLNETLHTELIEVKEERIGTHVFLRASWADGSVDLDLTSDQLGWEAVTVVPTGTVYASGLSLEVTQLQPEFLSRALKVASAAGLPTSRLRVLSEGMSLEPRNRKEARQKVRL